MGPSGFIAVLAGWIVTEVGRQPWTVYGLLRTAESVSPTLTGLDVFLSPNPVCARRNTAILAMIRAWVNGGIGRLLDGLTRWDHAYAASARIRCSVCSTSAAVASMSGATSKPDRIVVGAIVPSRV